MASLVPGYEYDIFISYRQKDNRHDGWVTGFVENLKGELESTFKEEISVYFDINPHDGLLETHDVDESLKEKLKCLVFIPIISRTYCDPKSFAWEHEFKVFVEKASQDKYGLKVKLPNGNVASRVLPVRIYDLDPGDIKLCESALGGVLRGVEFIYAEPGVNRPLKLNDDEKTNLNRTKYINQINKVANAIKEIISALGQDIPEKEEIPKKVLMPVNVSRKKYKPAMVTGLIIVSVLLLAVILLIPKILSPADLEKSIAVLPFVNNSPDTANVYFLNGIMDRITTNLQMIKELRLIDQTSVEQYRNIKTKSIPEIARELGVNYIVAGSGQKYGDSFSLTVRLVKAKGKETQLWAKPYDNQQINEVNDYFRIQSEVARIIAAELKAVITPEEKLLIDKIPTKNLRADDFYQRGREEEGRFPYYDITESNVALAGLNPSTRQAVERAEKMYKTALEYDSTFALAYTALAGIYWRKNYYKEYFSENFLDSVLKLANRALYYDDKLCDAYFIRGAYYGTSGQYKQAYDDFDRAIKINPNYWLAYYGKGNYSDYPEALDNFLQAASRHHGAGLSTIFKNIGSILSIAGFRDLAEKYIKEVIKLEPDSTSYYFWLYMHEFEHNKCYKFYKTRYSRDSTDLKAVEFLSEYYAGIGQYGENLKFLIKWLNLLRAQGNIRINNVQRVGYAYSKNGFKDSAEYYFNKQIEYCNEDIRLNRGYAASGAAYYDLAGVYAYRGDSVKAYENLRKFLQNPTLNLWINRFINYDPLFDGIRDEAEFQGILKELNLKYQAEHERVRKWLEEKGMI